MLSNEHAALVKACKKNILRGLMTVDEAIATLRANGVNVNDFMIDELIAMENVLS